MIERMKKAAEVVKHKVFPCEKIMKELRAVKYEAMERNAAAHDRIKRLCAPGSEACPVETVRNAFPSLRKNQIVNPW